MRKTIQVRNLVRENAQRFEEAALKVTGVQHVETWPGRAEIELSNENIIPVMIASLKTAGFDVVTSNVIKICVDGMTCHSCEITVERKLRDVAGVKKVDVNSATGTARIICHDGCTVDLQKLQAAIAGEKYTVRDLAAKSAEQNQQNLNQQRPSFLRLLGLFALVLLISSLFDKLGIFGQQTGVTQSMTLAAAIILGLVAGTSSCLAVSGGLLLSSAGKFNERYHGASKSERMRPVFLFVAGRIFSYGFLGGLIGLLGTAFTFSPFTTGMITAVAALYMLIMGLNMLKISPKWLNACLPRMPKILSHRIADAEGKEHWSAPFLLGAATFFLPCGFTQALQVYALTTGSFFGSAAILAGFAIGTAPALLALGWASSSLKGKFGKLFFQFSGALVIVLGLWNMQNGLTLAGYPISLPQFKLESAVSAETDTKQDTDKTDPNVKLEGETQVIRMKLINNRPYYSPSDTFTVKAGLPVRMEIIGQGYGCRSALQIPKLKVGTYLDQDINILEFTPDKPGQYSFSCSMGMYRGTLNVVST